jgi:DNA-binding MarR family transcriptional regulator
VTWDTGQPKPPTEALRDVQEAAWFALSLAQRLQENYARHAGDLGLTATQAKVLTALQPDQPVSQRTLARDIGLDPSNLTALIDRLEARGDLRREAEPNDRRVKMLVLTNLGVSTRDAFRRALMSDAGPLAHLTPEQVRGLRDHLAAALKFD